MAATAYVIDGGMIALAAWLLIRPPAWVRRYWARSGTSRGYTGALVVCAAATLVVIYLAIKLPSEVSGAIRFQMLLPFLGIDLMCVAQYRGSRQLTQP